VSGAFCWNGTKGSDYFVFNNDLDRFDLVWAGRGRDFISDGKDDHYWSNDEFHGQRGNDTLISTGGDDLLYGGWGNDLIKVRASSYDPAEMQFPMTDVHSTLGFDVQVFGGRGHDVLQVLNSDGFTIEYDGSATIIHTAHGGTITVHGVEEFHFL
jgi:Ca2+-binding RTX toxin-like protein